MYQLQYIDIIFYKNGYKCFKFTNIPTASSVVNTVQSLMLFRADRNNTN
jgi:hypothetical protein